jgi:uncharacterized protein YecE (DUF72 family)
MPVGFDNCLKTRSCHGIIIAGFPCMKQHGQLYIGTSGWHYKHWNGTFYPAGTKTTHQLPYYLQFFSTVEINNSFYRLPGPETFAAWRKATPTGFVFAVKGSRFLTHMKKLNIEKEGLGRFFNSVKELKEKAGPILFQLPPRWNVNAQRLSDFLTKLPKKYRYAFEFRNSTWYTEEVYAVLRKHGCAFCVYELAGHVSPVITTAGFVYVRLHGPGNKYQGSYTRATLKKWMRQCTQWRQQGRDVYIYFDNDQAGYAAFNAITLKTLAAEAVVNKF